MNTRFGRLSLIAAAAALAFGACKPSVDAQEGAGRSAISVLDPWAAATPSAASVAAGYVTLRNRGPLADRLLSAESPRAARVELHEMSVSGGMMRMRRVEAVHIPASSSAVFAPGALHIMFIDIDAPFVEGQTVPVTLRFERQGALHANFVVRRRRATGGSHEGH